MITIIAGSQSITSPLRLLNALEACGWVPSKVICGCAPGPDRLGYAWARPLGIPVEFFPAWQNQADWARSVALPGEIVHWPNPNLPKGKGAGPARNYIMAQNAKALLALWDWKSPGTRNMIRRAEKLGLNVYAHLVYTPPLTPTEFNRLYQGEFIPEKPSTTLVEQTPEPRTIRGDNRPWGFLPWNEDWEDKP